MKSTSKLISVTKRRTRLALVLLVSVACSQADDFKQAAAQAEALPASTGPHKTGRMSFHWKDAARAELETSAPDDKRELMVHLFYPTDAKASGARASYIPDADAMRGPWNDEMLGRITAMRAFSHENAALPRGNARYPVIIFAPGGGMKALTCHVLLEDLASHSWVVAAIDPPYTPRHSLPRWARARQPPACGTRLASTAQP